MAFSITLNQNFNSISIMVKDNKIFGQLPAKREGSKHTDEHSNDEFTECRRQKKGVQ